MVMTTRIETVLSDIEVPVSDTVRPGLDGTIPVIDIESRECTTAARSSVFGR